MALNKDFLDVTLKVLDNKDCLIYNTRYKTKLVKVKKPILYKTKVLSVMCHKGLKTTMTEITMSNTSPLVEYVSLKNERLASAIYMVTNLMPDSEPLKWKLRDLSIGIISTSRFCLNNSEGQNSDNQKTFSVVGGLVSQIDEIVSLINVSLSAGTVSQMNFTILKQEYLSLKDLLVSNFSANNFGSYLLSGGEKEVISPMVGLNDQGTTPPSLTEKTKDKIESEHYINYLKTDRPSVNKNSNNSSVRSVPIKNTESLQKDSRKSTITNYLKGRDWTSIKDIARVVPNCSVKTVQRELVELVTVGALEKIGERRWSRYKLLLG